nr:MAG TPA: hypothetical protein [Caudoviricetes sp.]
MKFNKLILSLFFYFYAGRGTGKLIHFLVTFEILAF